MTIQERIDRARAELERQEAEDKAGTPGLWGINAWPQRGFDVRIGAKGTPRIASVPDRDVSINEQKANAAVICRARNLNPARLAVARGELEYAIERRDDLSASSADWNVSPDDKAAMLDEMFDGNGGLSIAECLLGLESAS